MGGQDFTSAKARWLAGLKHGKALPITHTPTCPRPPVWPIPLPLRLPGVDTLAAVEG